MSTEVWEVDQAVERSLVTRHHLLGVYCEMCISTFHSK